MIRSIMLDAGPLGMLAHPKAKREIVDWLRDLLEAGTKIIIPEIADYEVRRSLLLEKLEKSVRRLDELKEVLEYSPITTDIMLQAAAFWAYSRKQGKPSCDLKELDADAILAAQAKATNAIIATNNVGHLNLFVEAYDWHEILANK